MEYIRTLSTYTCNCTGKEGTENRLGEDRYRPPFQNPGRFPQRPGQGFNPGSGLPQRGNQGFNTGSNLPQRPNQGVNPGSNPAQRPNQGFTPGGDSQRPPFVNQDSNSNVGTNPSAAQTAQTGGALRPPPVSSQKIISLVPCSCPFTPEYSPVCGSDNQTYLNPAVLNCYRTCGFGE